MERLRHFEESVSIPATPNDVFSFADDHRNFSAHMNQSSWMMAGSKMETEIDEEQGKKVGSHIKMSGRMMGIDLSLDEVITVYDPPHQKVWETRGDVNLVVIDQYTLGFKIEPESQGSQFTVYIDYDLPKSWKTRVLGMLLGGMYAKWCVRQMINGTKDHFISS